MSNTSTRSADRSHWLPDNWHDWSFPDPEVIENQLKEEFPGEDRAKAWDNAAMAVKAYHDELVEQWQKAMDSLLTYAGLFSAVLTAFNVQSYQLLQPAPTDPMLVILATLQQIPTQLNSFSINPSFINSTQPARSTANQLQPPFRAPVSAIWINTMWFASLVCSLASASIALMVKQWLFEASQGLSGTSRETARRRQYRLNNLIKWKVGAIVLIPSLLLQVALFLFLGGLLILLWTIHETVAAVITALVGALFVFVAVVTVLPIFRLDCCYRSPQAFGLFVLARPLFRNTVGRLAIAILIILPPLCLLLLTKLFTALVDSGDRLFSDTSREHRILKGLEEYFNESCMNIVDSFEKEMSTWNATEHMEVSREDGVLDRHIAAMAYTTTFATEQLKTLHFLLSDLPHNQVYSCFADICESWNHLVGSNDGIQKSGKVAELLCGQAFYCALQKGLTVHPPTTDSVLVDHWTKLSSDHIDLPMGSRNLPLSGQCLSALALTSIGEFPLAQHAFSLLNYRFNDALCSESVPFIITYKVLRDVMALGRYNIGNWVPLNDSTCTRLSIVCLSLACTRLFLASDPSLNPEQEEWIRKETLSLLSSLAGKLNVDQDASNTLKLSMDQFASKMLNQLVKLVACADIAEGYELVPEELLSIQLPEPPNRLFPALEALQEMGELRPGMKEMLARLWQFSHWEWRNPDSENTSHRLARTQLQKLKYVINQQKRKDQLRHTKRCFRTQHPPEIVL